MINIVPFDKNKIDKELDNNIYKFLNNNIKETIFNILGFSFFRKNILYSDLVGLFHDTHNNEPKLLIAYISSENEKKLNKIIFIYLLKNIHKVLLKPSYFFSLLTNPRTLKYDSNTTQLLTLIIESSYYKGKIDLSSRDKIIDNFHYKYVNQKNSNKLFAVFAKANHVAKKYYLRNKFNIFYSNKFYLFVEKKY